MAQIDYRANLASRSFPLLPSNQGNTVIVAGPDQAYSRYGSPAERIRDVDTPHAFYMQNFLPTMEGYTSVGYRDLQNTLVSGLLDDSPYRTGPNDIAAYQAIRAINGVNWNTIIECKTGVFYFEPNGLNPFNSASGNTITPTATQYAELSSYANIGGRTYSFFVNNSTGINTFNIWNSSNWADAGVLGLAVASVTNIVAASGYLIACSGLSVAWSSTTNPIDFVPSLITGAGGASVQELGGSIRFAAATAFGFILYTDSNCVSAVYTGNSKYPFKFSEIKGAGGFLSQRLTAGSDSQGYHIAITKAGLQKLSISTSESFLPELSDFIFGVYGEEYNYVTGNFDSVINSLTVRQPAGRLRLISSRYLTYSYNSNITIANPQVYDYLLVYDMQLERWGKLKRNHVDVYTQVPSLPIINRPNAKLSAEKEIVLLSSGGNSSTLVLGGASLGAGNESILPVIFFGRYEYVRSRHLILDKVAVSGLMGSTSITGAQLSVAAIASKEDGTDSAAVIGYLASPDTQRKNIQYNFSLDGSNIALKIMGAVELTSLELSFHLGGKI